MPNKQQKQVIDLVKRFSPREFGIKGVYYKLSKSNIELLFVVDKSNASSSMSYLNSLASIIENEVKGVKIESSVYIKEKGSRVENVIAKEKLSSLELTSLSFAGANI